MRRPAQLPTPPRRPARGQVSGTVSLPAPVKGWITAKPLADMPAGSAVLLDNWFPETDSVRPRRGSRLYVQGLGGRAVEGLFSLVSGAKRAFFASAGPSIYDITNPAQPLLVRSGFSSARWYGLNFSTAGAPYLLLFNGIDPPQAFDGSTWQTIAFTIGGTMTPGNSSANAVPFDARPVTTACAYNGRLFMAAGSTVYYPAPFSFAGDLGTLLVGPELSRGGSIVNLSRWTHDAGQGPQDMLACISDQGELVLYTGTNPSSAAAWSLVGKYDIAPLLGGARATAKLGGDLGILSKDGLLAMSKIPMLDRAEDDTQGALTSNIRNVFKEDAEAFGMLYGWQVHVHRERGMLLVNVPLAENIGLSRQYVMNVQTGAWARFNNLNAICWHSFGGNLYFGATNGRVIQADVPTAYGDLDQPTACAMICAFSDLKTRGTIKQATMMRPLVTTRAPVTLQVGLSTDFYLTLPTSAANPQSMGNTRFSRSQYGVASQPWASVGAVGFAFAPSVFCQLDASTPAAAEPRVTAFDLVLQKGGLL